MTKLTHLDANNFRPSIVYVDEVKDERDNFFNDAFDSELFENIYTLHPRVNLKEFVNEIIDLHVDALITDFNLSEAGPLSYNGEQLVSAFLETCGDFPCFIRTSFDEDALISSDDVNRVYSKNVADEESAGRYLFKRIALQIEHHRRKITEWQKELADLLEKEKSQLTAFDINRIIELDTKIENSFGKDMAIPISVKKGLFESENKLIEETERLVSDIKRALGE